MYTKAWLEGKRDLARYATKRLVQPSLLACLPQREIEFILHLILRCARELLEEQRDGDKELELAGAANNAEWWASVALQIIADTHDMIRTSILRANAAHLKREQILGMP